VLNDERYGMVEMGHEQVYGRRPDYPAGPMSVPLMAESVGAQAVTITRSSDFEGVELPSMLEHGPVVLDVRIDRGVQMPKSGRNQSMRQAMKAKVVLLN
jgi:thiamine pyrophosphate-dependent acetolactate synthase large subunit-like protein